MTFQDHLGAAPALLSLVIQIKDAPSQTLDAYEQQSHCRRTSRSTCISTAEHASFRHLRSTHIWLLNQRVAHWLVTHLFRRKLARYSSIRTPRTLYSKRDSEGSLISLGQVLVAYTKVSGNSGLSRQALRNPSTRNGLSRPKHCASI
jgi:hypothetical protein